METALHVSFINKSTKGYCSAEIIVVEDLSIFEGDTLAVLVNRVKGLIIL
jgi:hypothetical protein